MKRILLTGASGFVGQSFVRKLAVDGQSSGVTLLPLADTVDIRDVAGLASAIASHAPDAVLHLAASRMCPPLRLIRRRPLTSMCAAHWR